MAKKDSNTADAGTDQEEHNLGYNIKHLHPYDKKLIKGFMRGLGKIMLLWLIARKNNTDMNLLTQIQCRISC
jgi:hypothetical protein